MGLKDLGDLMKQAGEIQQKMQSMQEEIANLEVTGESGAGLVQVTMTGRHEIRRVHIDPSLYGPDADLSEKEVLEDLIAAACNDAARRVEAAQQEKMSSMAGGLGLPMGQMLF